MFLQTKFVFGAVMLAAALGVVSPLAGEENYKGKFNLRYETYWGGTVLPPGEYTLWIDNHQTGPAVLRASGNGKVASAMIGPFDFRPVTGKGRIVLAEVDGIQALKEFDAGVLGKSFSFTVPKAIHEKVGRASMPAAAAEITVR